MRRLFIALPFPDSACESLKEIHCALSRAKALKAVRPDQYHLTLKFFGECDGKRAEGIEQGFGGVGVGKVPVPFSLEGMGVFPGLQRPKVLWVGIRDEKGLIEGVFNAVSGFAASLGFPGEERAFSPHLTVARLRRDAILPRDIIALMEDRRDEHFARSEFQKVVLYESKLMPGGPVYTEVQSIMLSGS